MIIGYHASHEQFKPSELLTLVQRAEQAGFQAALSSDHFHPWSKLQGESGFAWSWLGAAMHATKLEFGIVNAPGQRYHPAIIAQAVATLLEMFPNRFWIATGSGEAVNENITGTKWPPKHLRNKRLQESVEVMRRLWTEEYVSFEGEVRVENAKLFTKPPSMPRVIGAALTEETAAWLAGWADGMITVSQPLEQLKKIINAFRKNGGETKPVYLKVQVSYDKTDSEAEEGAWEQWRNNIFPSKITTEMDTPEQFDELGRMVSREQVGELVITGSSADKFILNLKNYQELGIEKAFIHNVNLKQEQFIDFFGKEVLPAFK